MSGQDKKFERVNQKRRTRVELLRAVRELIAGGKQNPTVGEVADHASISRATAYRYFSSPEELVREAVLDGVADRIVVQPAAEDDGPEEVGTRLDALVSEVSIMVAENEGVFRALLGASATGTANVRRGGRRIGWLKEATSPLQKKLPKKRYERLVNALALVTGVEGLVVARDICELDHQQAEDLFRWVAKAMLIHTLSET